MASIGEVIGGLDVLKKYGNDFAVGHDQIWAGPTGEKDVVSAEDQEILNSFDWFWDEEFECWTRFV